MERAIQWFYDKKAAGVTYSMAQRNGPKSYDCSSAVYYSLIQEGKLPSNHRIGNTDSLYGDLEKSGWTQVRVVNGTIDAQRGDIFLWGVRGQSGGASGHTGIFTDANNIIHCAYGYNGIHVDNHDLLHRINGYPGNTIYRYTGAPTPPPTSNSRDQLVEVGSYIRFDGTFTVADVAHVGGIWQVRSNALCKNGFTWDENGIPAEPLVEVENGYATPDQFLEIGTQFKIPGKFAVHDLGYVQDMWLAMIEWNGMYFWVDIEYATEIDASDPGTAAPGQKPADPAPVPITPAPEVTPTPTPVDPVPETPTPEVPEIVPDPVVPLPEDDEDVPQFNEEEIKMAFSKEDQAQLLIATEKVQVIADDVASQAIVKEITDSIPTKVKVAVYIIGDTLIGIGLLVPAMAVVLQTGSVDQVAALASVFATAGAFILTMFGIYKSGKK